MATSTPPPTTLCRDYDTHSEACLGSLAVFNSEGDKVLIGSMMRTL